MTRTALGAAAGVLSAAAGVGASLLVGALLGGAPTPVTAVGNRFVDATPGPLKDWAVRTFGENDKLVLLSGIGVVLAVIAAIIGIIGWRNRRLSLTLATGLGLVAVVAALLDRSVLFGVVAQALPSVVALVVSVGLLAWFTHSWAVQTQASVHRPASPTVSPTARPARSGPSPSPRGFDRRAFLSAALASGAVTVVGVGTSRAFGNSGATSRASIRLPRPTDRAAPLDPAVSLDVDGITPYLTANKAFYRVDTALSVPQVDAGSWSLRVHGMVDQDIELSFEDLLDMRLIERRITMTCVSNQVGGGLVGNATWLGVPLTDILDRVGVSSGA
ncbi:MAG: molybdopterin-dependent oxidoreductase, partial [Nocardioidaceae bacterium]